MKYIFDLLDDIKGPAKNGDAPRVHYACKTVVSELRKLDRHDFRPEAQADFVRLISFLEQWGRDIRGVDVKKEWEGLEPAIVQTLNAYTGEGSHGDPDFRKKQAFITAYDRQTPPELAISLPHFMQDHPDPSRCAFIMMRFGDTLVHKEIAGTIRTTLAKFGMKGLRADDKEYHDALFPNVLTYIHGCSFGIAVFERLEGDEFNPNVAIEVGYMGALGKPLCLLKDQTLKALPTDLVGKLYKGFNTQNVARSIPPQLEKWMTDKGWPTHEKR